MANRDSTQKMIEDSIATGIKNQALIPSIKNWCENIVLKNETGGMVAMYGLPITVAVSCPHGKGMSMGMQLEWIVGSYILENCINCKFQKEAASDNFGRNILLQKEENEKEAKIKTNKEDSARVELHTRINELIKQKKDKEKITELSVLQLIETLKDENKKTQNAPLILQASEMNPAFFSDLSLNALSIYFRDETIGHYCIEAIVNVIKSKNIFPEKFFIECIEVLEKGINFNAIALVLQHYINAVNIEQHESSILLIIESLWYERNIGEPYSIEHNYDHSIGLLLHLIEANEFFMLHLFKERLLINEKAARININNVLQIILLSNNKFVFTLLPEIILSLNLDDDRYLDSADMATLNTLSNLFKVYPDTVYKTIEEKKAAGGEELQIALLPFAKILFKDQVFLDANPVLALKLVADMVQKAILKNLPEKVHDKIIDEIYYLSNDHAILFESHFDTLIGYLSRLVDDEKTLVWWLDELKTKKAHEITTFNPLVGRNYWEIELQKVMLQKDIRHIKDIIKNIFALNPEQHLSSIQQLIKNLDSKLQEKLKKELLNVMTGSINDPWLIAKLIPDLYTNLLDINSIEIRIEAMQFLDRIISKHPQLVTQTLFDLINAFMTDNEIGVKGMTTEIIGSIARDMPERLTETHIQFLIDCLSNSYKYVHKKAAQNCYKIYPFTSKSQRMQIVLGLSQWEPAYYKNEEYDFCETLIDQMLRFAREVPPLVIDITRKVVLKYCTIEEHYVAKGFLERLEEIKVEYREFENDWFSIVMKNLIETKPNFYNNDYRDELFTSIYKLSYDTIQQQINLIVELLDTRTEDDSSDIAEALNILSYFEQYDVIIKQTDNILANFKQVKSTEHLFKFCAFQQNFSKYEISVLAGIADKNYLKNLTDELEKTGS